MKEKTPFAIEKLSPLCPTCGDALPYPVEMTLMCKDPIPVQCKKCGGLVLTLFYIEQDLRP